jgi:hypothetical protein
MQYNYHRPHQGINNLTPMQKAKMQHPIWVRSALGIT